MLFPTGGRWCASMAPVSLLESSRGRGWGWGGGEGGVGRTFKNTDSLAPLQAQEMQTEVYKLCHKD